MRREFGDIFWEDFNRTYESLADRDGWARSNNQSNATTGPIVGDLDGTVPGLHLRAIYSFDTGGISRDAEIQSARLRVYQENTFGSPYTAGHGNVVVDHVNIGAALDSTDLTGGTVAPNVGTLSTNAVLEWKEVDVTSAVQNAVSTGLTHSEFRLHFESDSNGNGATDYIILNDGEDSLSSGRIPQLVVQYRSPRL